MTPGNKDSYKSLKKILINNKEYKYYSLAEAEKNGLDGINKLPKSLKVLLENLLRYEDELSVNKLQIDAVKDWAMNGAAAENAYDIDAAKQRIQLPSESISLAHANFRLGVYLRLNGKELEGDKFLATAIDLHPDSWNMFRQAMNLRDIGEVMGLAADQDFFDRVDALGEKRYYPAPDIKGFPSEAGYDPKT